MLYTISWMVMREPQAARERIRAGVLTSLLAGGIIGGALMGALLAFVARELYYISGSRPAVFVTAAAVLAAVYAGRAADLWRVPKPQSPHQVPEAWRNIFQPRVASFIYAGGLGTIYFTRLASLAAYPLALLLIGMGGTPLAIIEIMAAVGLMRASAALAVPFLRLDREGSEAVPALMQKYSATVRHGELLVLLSLTSLPFVGLLIHYLH